MSLLQRSAEDLRALIGQFLHQIQIVSEELVCMLQERHELREQVEMRKIAVEQLLQLKQATTALTNSTTSSSSNSIVSMTTSYDDVSNDVTPTSLTNNVRTLVSRTRSNTALSNEFTCRTVLHSGTDGNCVMLSRTSTSNINTFI